ncbi:hypothetical protein ABHI18_004402 [Aspergillus niger]
MARVMISINNLRKTVRLSSSIVAVAALDQLRSLFSGTTGSIVTPINKNNNNNNNKNEFADRYQAAVTPPGRTLAGPLQLDDGSLINANSKGSSDLHCALESSGSDFGIVTLFDLEPHLLIKIQ